MGGGFLGGGLRILARAGTDATKKGLAYASILSQCKLEKIPEDKEYFIHEGKIYDRDEFIIAVAVYNSESLPTEESLREKLVDYNGADSQLLDALASGRYFQKFCNHYNRDYSNFKKMKSFNNPEISQIMAEQDAIKPVVEEFYPNRVVNALMARARFLYATDDIEKQNIKKEYEKLKAEIDSISADFNAEKDLAKRKIYRDQINKLKDGHFRSLAYCVELSILDVKSKEIYFNTKNHYIDDRNLKYVYSSVSTKNPSVNDEVPSDNLNESKNLKCPNCGKELPESSAFCMYCGKQIS